MQLYKNDPSKLFFLSDLHIGHGNIMKYCRRTQFFSKEELDIFNNPDTKGKLKVSYDSIQRMNNHIFQCLEETVPKNGTLFLLGDSFLCCGKEEIDDFLEYLDFEIIFLRGNHDNSLEKAGYTLYDAIDLIVDDVEGFHDKQLIVLYHYSQEVWNLQHKGAWHLFGHSHGTLPLSSFKKIDVGVDAVGYRPLSYRYVKEIMKLKSLPVYDDR